MPSLGVYYYQQLTLSVPLSHPFKLLLFFVSRWNRSIFWPSVLRVALYKTLFLHLWFGSPNDQNLLPQICTKWPITRWPVVSSHGQFNTGRFITQKLLYSAIAFNESFSKVYNGVHPQENIYVIVIKKMSKLKFKIKTITRLVWHIDRRCLGLPGGFRWWPIQWNHAKCRGADTCCHSN